MVQVFSTKSVKGMDENTKEQITRAGIPLEYYTNGSVTLGPMNKGSITKFLNYNTTIVSKKLPLPPSLFTEMVVDRCTDPHDKQDFREIIDGEKPGDGKSTSALYKVCRYAMAAAERHGQDPKDYFTLANAALLQDTEKITCLLDELDKYQAVLIDDAGVGAGARDFATQSNKNISAIMQTCRPKRWYVVFTAPMDDMVDIHIRKLSYCKSKITKPCHAAGFNLVSYKGVSHKYYNNKKHEWNPHYQYGNIRITTYACFYPELLEPYKGIMGKYDEGRYAASVDLIHQRAVQEKENKDPRGKREKNRQELLTTYLDDVRKRTHDIAGNWLPDKRVKGMEKGDYYSIKGISAELGLPESSVRSIIGHLKQRGG